MVTAEMGCVLCYQAWADGGHPALVGHSALAPVSIYRCSTCDTYWLETKLYATPIPVDDVELHAPDLALQLSQPAPDLAGTDEGSARSRNAVGCSL